MCLEALCGVEHEDGHITVFDGTNGTQHTIELDVLLHLALLAQTGRVDEHKLHAEGVVSCVVGVARSARDVGHDMAVGAEESID